jgi:3-phosphoshikimate 1-carboxyvinyltransferase
MSAPAAAPLDVARVGKAARIRGVLEVPGDKSISHRGALMNAIAHGTATIDNYLPGADCLSTLDCLRALGVDVTFDLTAANGKPRVTVVGRGGQFAEAIRPLDCGNSGTTMRLMSGVLAGQPIFSVLTGDASLSSRPMARVVDPLRQMGAKITGRQGGRLAPLAIEGGSLKAIDYASSVASAQVKSCVLLAGVQTEGVTIARSPAGSRDHTERLLSAQGAKIEANADGTVVAVHGGAQLQAVDVIVPGDSSSAAYWLALACVHPDAEITIENVGMNPGRTGFIEILRDMGGDVEIRNERVVAGEPRADLVARSSRLKGVSVGGTVVPRAIDELPLVAVVGLFANGVTEIRDAAELRVKESDRIASLGRELTRLGGQIEELSDGLRVLGGASLEAATCETLGDHRLAMSLAVAGLAGAGVDVIDAGCAVVSYPGFWEQMRAVGGPVTVVGA